ncbi:MAG: hypothetical protein R2698_08085 [Microthrixaceae bacterium]
MGQTAAHNLLLVVHVLAVAMWLGTNIALGVAAARPSPNAETEAWWAETKGFIAATVKNTAFLLLLLSGIGMIVEGNGIKFSAPFVSVGFLVVIVGGALTGAVFMPGARKLAEAHRGGDKEAAARESGRLGMIGAAETLLVVVALLFMVFQWGGLGS